MNIILYKYSPIETPPEQHLELFAAELFFNKYFGEVNDEVTRDKLMMEFVEYCAAVFDVHNNNMKSKVVCDRTNNTSHVIDANGIVVDIYYPHWSYNISFENRLIEITKKQKMKYYGI